MSRSLRAPPRRPAAAGALGEAPPARRRRHWVRATFAVVLITLGVILAPLAVVAHWAQRELTDTDVYLATIVPLGTDPVVQSALENRITDAVMEKIDVPSLVEGASSALEERGLERAAEALTLLEGSVTGGIEGFVRDTTAKVVESDAFETVWREANRTAHEQLVAVLQGEEGNVLQISDDGALTIQLSSIIEQVKVALVDSGLGVASKIPEIDASFPIVQSTELVRLQNAYNAVVMLGTWLPWLSIGLIAAGVLTAVRRPRALMVAGLALAGSMVVLGLGLTIGRSLYLNALAGQVERLDAAEVIFDQLVTFIRLSLRTVGVAGLVIALVAYLAGGSDSARAVRGGLGRGFAAVRGWGENRGVSTGPFGAWLYRLPAGAARGDRGGCSPSGPRRREPDSRVHRHGGARRRPPGRSRRTPRPTTRRRHPGMTPGIRRHDYRASAADLVGCNQPQPTPQGVLMASGNTPVLDAIAEITAVSLERTDLDARSLILVRLAALIAVDAPAASYLLHVGPAMDVDVTLDDVQDVLIAVAPVVGTARTLSAAAKVVDALGAAIVLEAVAEAEEAADES